MLIVCRNKRWWWRRYLNNGFMLNNISWKFCFVIQRDGTTVSVKAHSLEFCKVARYGGYHGLDSLS
jgi:hypothetical protein